MIWSFNFAIWLGIYMNVSNIWKIKHNLQILQSQNDLQESQILELAQYLNLTIIQVQEYHGLLYELNTKPLVFNNTLAKTMEAVNNLHYMTTLVTNIHTTVTRLTSGIFSLKAGVESFYECMQVLAKH